jgi:hypothetical protein
VTRSNVSHLLTAVDADAAGPSSPRFGIAYFGVRDPDHYRMDLAQIAAQGFAWVLLPFTHDDAVWERSTFADLVAVARDAGLAPVISPWGGREFGGEGVQTDLEVLDWLTRAKATGAETLHVDEPRLATLTLTDVLDAWGDDANLWLTMQPERAAELPESIARRVAVLGTDAYDGTVKQRIAATSAFAADAGRLELAWVRAFRIAAGEEASVGDCVRAMAELAPLVGVWGWKGSTGRGDLRSANPALVQATVAAAIAEIRLTEAA